MASPNYLGKNSRLVTPFDRWLARVQHRAKFNQAARERAMFGEIDRPVRGRWDEHEERFLTVDEMP